MKNLSDYAAKKDQMNLKMIGLELIILKETRISIIRNLYTIQTKIYLNIHP